MLITILFNNSICQVEENYDVEYSNNYNLDDFIINILLLRLSIAAAIKKPH